MNLVSHKSDLHLLTLFVREMMGPMEFIGSMRGALVR